MSQKMDFSFQVGSDPVAKKKKKVLLLISIYLIILASSRLMKVFQEADSKVELEM